MREERFSGSWRGVENERGIGGVETGGDGSETGSVTKNGKNGRPVSVPASPDYRDKEESDNNTAR